MNVKPIYLSELFEKQCVCISHTRPSPPTAPHKILSELYTLNYIKSTTIFILITFLTIIATNAFAQNLSGKITSHTNNPLEFVTISINKDSLLLNSTISNSNGIYVITVPNNIEYYTISFTLIGYKKFDTTIKNNLNIPLNIVLNTDNTQLKAVTVSSKKPLVERKIDRLIFNVENNVNTVGSDALEILSITPMVRVINDGISLVGKSDVGIMVDDKLLYLNGEGLRSYLKSIPAESISKIEVITNPSAKYEAKGNSGLINIVTKKIKKLGYTGSVNSTLSHATYNGINAGTNMNYNTKKMQFFGGLSFAKGAGAPYSAKEIYYQNQTWLQSYTTKEFSKFIRGLIGFEIPISKKTNLGLSYNGFNSQPDVDSKNTSQINNNHTGAIDSTITAINKIDKLFTTSSINFHLNHKIDSSGKKIAFDADWFQNKFDQSNLINNTNYFTNGQITPFSALQYLSANGEKAKIFTLNTVVDIPINKTARFSFGGKFSFLNNTSNVALSQNINNVFKIDSNNTNAFQYNENIQAAFISYNNSYKKWEIQLGLRAEASQTTGNSVTLSQKNKNSYFNIFPTIYFSYNANQKNIFSLNYGRRINRPSFSSLNPFRTYLDKYYYFTGNPFLKPSFSNNLELSHTYNDLLTTSLSYSYSKNQLGALTLIENGSNTQIITFGNFLTSSNYALSTSISLTKVKWLESENQASVYFEDTKSTNIATPQHTKGWGADFSTINNIFFNKTKTITGGVNFTYQFPFVSGLRTNKNYYWLDISVKYLLLKKQLQLGAGLRDVFKTKFVSSSQYVNNILIKNTANNDSRRIIINIRYSFGNFKIKKGQAYSNSAEEQSRGAH